MAEDKLPKLLEKIKDALEALVHLQIVTAVGPVNITLKSGGETESITIKENIKAAVTSIDLLQGDITTVYDPEFVTGQYQELKTFHAAREKEGHEIVKKNLEAVQALAKLVKEMIDNK
jgi:hypothetical protein